MAITAKLLTDTQLSERLAKVGEGLPDAAAVMVVEWRSRAEALRRHAKVFLGFIVLALVHPGVSPDPHLRGERLSSHRPFEGLCHCFVEVGDEAFDTRLEVGAG